MDPAESLQNLQHVVHIGHMKSSRAGVTIPTMQGVAPRLRAMPYVLTGVLAASAIAAGALSARTQGVVEQTPSAVIAAWFMGDRVGRAPIYNASHDGYRLHLASCQQAELVAANRFEVECLVRVSVVANWWNELSPGWRDVAFEVHLSQSKGWLLDHVAGIPAVQGSYLGHQF
jgi:hypothetical protein